MATADWECVRIYLAGAFADMLTEREAIEKTVLPRLRAQCVALKVHVEIVDLRKGLTEKGYIGLSKTKLQVFFKEIDRCRPFFVCLLGERYGDELPTYDVPADPDYLWLTRVPKERSLFELEILYGAVADPVHTKALFLLRDPAFMLSTLFKQEYALYATHEGASKLPEISSDSRIGDIFKEPTQTGMEKLQQLKQAIQIKFPAPRSIQYCPEYLGVIESIPRVGGSGLTTMTTTMEMSLLQDIRSMYSVSLTGTPRMTLEELDHAAALHDHLAHKLIGRDTIIDLVLRHLRLWDPYTSPILLVGPAGCGLTAVMAHLVNMIVSLHLYKTVIVHFVGAAPFSANARWMLRRLVTQLSRANDMDVSVPEDFYMLTKAFAGVLQSIENKPNLLLIDSLHDIEDVFHGHMLSWLPIRLSIPVIMSTLENTEQHRVLSRRLPAAIEVRIPPLDANQSQAFISSFFLHHNRSLSVEQIMTVTGKEDGGKPVYLSLVCREIHRVGKKEALFSLNPVLLDLVRKMPPTMLRASQFIQENIARDFSEYTYGRYTGGSLLDDCLCFLGCSRYGLKESELIDLLFPLKINPGEGKQLPHLMWAHVYEELATFFKKSAERRISTLQLNQRAMKRAVEVLNFPDVPAALGLWAKVYNFKKKRLKGADEDLHGMEGIMDVVARNLEERYHTRLSQHYGRRDERGGRKGWAALDRRVMLELPYHLCLSKLWKQLETTLLDLRFVEGKLRLGYFNELQSDFILAQQSLAAQKNKDCDKRRLKLQEMHRFLLQHANLLSLSPHLIFQLAANTPNTSPMSKSARMGWKSGAVRLRWVKWKNKPVIIEPCIQVMHAHAQKVSALSFSSDGLRVISVSSDSQMCHWDALSGLLIAAFPVSVLPAMSCCILRGNTLVDFGRRKEWVSDMRAAVSSRDKVLSVWNLRTGDHIFSKTGHNGRITHVSTDRKGRYIFTCSWDSSVRMWSAINGDFLGVVAKHEGAVLWAALAPDEKLLATAGEDELIRLWDLPSRSMVGVLEGHDNAVTCLSFTADGRYLLSSSTDTSAKLWDSSTRLEEGEGGGSSFDVEAKKWRRFRVELATLAGHTDRVYCCAIHSNGSRGFTAGKDGTLRIWDTTMTAEMKHKHSVGEDVFCSQLAVLRGHEGPIYSLAVSPDCRRVVTGSEDTTIRLWDSSSKSWSGMVRHDASVGGVGIAPRGHLAASGSGNIIRFWDTRKGQHLRDVKLEGLVVRCMAVSMDSTRAAAGAEDGTIRIVGTSDENIKLSLRHSYSPVNVVSFSYAGNMLMAACAQGKVKMWFGANYSLITNFDAHDIAILAASLSRNASILVTASEDTTLKVWKVRFKTLQQLKEEEEELEEKKRLEEEIARKQEKAIQKARLGDLAAARLLRDPFELRRVTVEVNEEVMDDNAWEEKMRQAESDSRDAITQVWDLKYTLSGHRGPIAACVMVRPFLRTYDAMIVSSSLDHSIKVWDAETGNNMRTILCQPFPITSLAMSSDGLCLVGGGAHTKGGLVMFWDILTWARVGEFYTEDKVTCVDAVGEASVRTAVGDEKGGVYLLDFGTEEPDAPETRTNPNEEKAKSKACVIL